MKPRAVKDNKDISIPVIEYFYASVAANCIEELIHGVRVVSTKRVTAVHLLFVVQKFLSLTFALYCARRERCGRKWGGQLRRSFYPIA